MKLNKPFYIDKRTGKNHISLDGEWKFLWLDEATEDISSLAFKYNTTLPSSIFHSLHKAGILPHPYYGVNSKEYDWVDEKVWYYKKTFALDSEKKDMNAFLSFEGVAYYCRVWINGVLLGDHEGMFGGPVCNVYEHLNFGGKNEIVVEVKACNYGKKDGFDPRNTNGENREIIPWNTARDTITGGGDFIVMGIWNSVRLELVPKTHISRPYIYTKSIGDNKATLHLEMQITDDSKSELTDDIKIFDFMRAKINDGKKAVVSVKICGDEKCVYNNSDEISLLNFHHRGLEEIVDTYSLALIYQKEIVIDNPRLWYPVGLGEAFLHDIEITLSVDGEILDLHKFSFGIRTFDADFTEGNRYCMQPGKFRFSINGRDFFLKGMNWMPIDFLYDILPKRYEWCLSLVKNAGIQLLRIWNGGVMPETDAFYEICDRMGIMVWQDQYISNTNHTENFPLDVLKSQCAYNLFRTRNHPSLVVVCGGNEFNPYAVGNAASMAVTEQVARMITPDRDYRNSSPDSGSAHIYLDMEPVWYRHGYRHIPFLAESGIHSFPNYKTFKKFLSEKEAMSDNFNLTSKTLREDFPELINHFTEFDPERVPRLISRASQITDVTKATLEDLCEAGQVQAYEVYQLMIQAMHESYPVCGGIMPWVFKRPWPTVGVQFVDGDDNPGFPYYALQNSYKNINVCWCQNWSIVKTGEEIPLVVKTLNDDSIDLSDHEITLTLYNPDFTICKEYTASYSDTVDFGTFTIPESFRNKCFIVSADITLNGVCINRSTYFNKCTEILDNPDTFKKYRTEPSDNFYFENGPFLKEEISKAIKTELTAKLLNKGTDGNYNYADIEITNISNIAAFPVTISMKDESKRFFLSDNFFLLKGNEKKTVRITCDKGEADDVVVKFWNK